MSFDTVLQSYDQLNNLKNLLGDKELMDCTFTFNDKTEISANRVILANASCVFRAMFYGKMKEDIVNIVDMSPDCFKVFRHFSAYFVFMMFFFCRKL